MGCCWVWETKVVLLVLFDVGIRKLVKHFKNKCFIYFSPEEIEKDILKKCLLDYGFIVENANMFHPCRPSLRQITVRDQCLVIVSVICHEEGLQGRSMLAFLYDTPHYYINYNNILSIGWEPWKALHYFFFSPSAYEDG